LTTGPAEPMEVDAATPGAAEERGSPWRAVGRAALIVGIWIVVFGIVLPFFIDYGAVWDAVRGLSPAEIGILAVAAVIAYTMAGLTWALLVPRLSILRGAMSWIIMFGMGSSVPLGPVNVGVTWVILRGWGVSHSDATTVIPVYGLLSTVSRLALPLIAVGALTVTGGFVEGGNPAIAWLIGGASFLLFALAVTTLVAAIRSDRMGGWIGATGQRVVDLILGRIDRASPDVEGTVAQLRASVGAMIRRKGGWALLASVLEHVVWMGVLVTGLRIAGVDDTQLTIGQIAIVYALVMIFLALLPFLPGGVGMAEVTFVGTLSAIAVGADQASITAGVFLYRLVFWFLPIPLAWILVWIARRGHTLLPGKAELREMAMRQDPAAQAGQST